MISRYEFETDERQREYIPDGPDTFSCICKFTDVKKYVGSSVPWHWHRPFEIDYLAGGTVHFKTPGTNVHMRQGEAVFVNANMLHTLESGEDDRESENYTIFFDAEFLAGGYGNLYSEKYISPVALSALESYLIRSDTPEGTRMLNLIVDIIDLFRNEPDGFEFEVRAQLCRFWLLLMHATGELRKENRPGISADALRMKKMIGFVEEHFGDKISLDDIAASADIGARECGRCFSRTVGASPVEYLNRYRVRQAARMLEESGEQIGLIAEMCGFASDSYFGKMFREMTGCTPREYRKRRTEEKDGKSI